MHTESPSNEDIIDGNSHNNISIKIAETLMRDDINIIGINGPLGSGKSTVIKLLEKNLQEDNFHFINFDAELYQQGSTKKALITKIYDGLIPRIPHSLKPKLIEFKDDALGNNVTYKKTQDSEVSTWAILFLFSLFVCTQSIRPLQNEWGKNPENINYYIIILYTSFLLSPLIVSLSFFIRSFWDKSLKFGNIIKKNSVDTITEKMLVSKEVGSIELHKAISGFKECIPPGIRFLLIIDNLDRIPSEKVKELWSDIELISNSSEKRLKLLIPYSSDHVAKSLSSDLYEGREFISKRIPISFQIPPILSAGWRNVFSHFWLQSFPNEADKLYHDTAELIEIWLPEAYQPITPRYLKKLINDIQITLLSTPYDVKNIVCAYYILTTKQNDISFDKLLIENFESNRLDDKLKEKFKKSIRKLQRVYSNDRKKWIDELLCINYQTNAQLAEGELIDEPLKIALIQYNPEELSRISNMFGFISAWRRVIDNTDPTDWFIILSKMPSEKGNLVKEILPVVIKSIDSMDVNGATTLENEIFLPSLNSLKKDGFNIHGLYIDNIKKRVLDKILNYISYNDDKLIELGENNNEIQSALQECNSLSQLLGYDLLTDLKTTPGAVFFVLNLKDKLSSYEYINIEGLKLKPKDFIHALQVLYLGGIYFNLTDRNISKYVSFENDGIKKILKDGLPSELNSIYNNFVSNTIPQNILSFEMVILTPQ
ncbi:P-loop NTPase fold protein [Pectobacterium punjabense]|uniref:P-loop NTPase fold protein n=1 Tax=Pectobacterium punjabense TaxID=2108399 RepID=UPI00311F95C3